AHTVATRETPLQCSTAALAPRRSACAAPGSTPSNIAIDPPPPETRTAHRPTCAAHGRRTRRCAPRPAPTPNARPAGPRAQARPGRGRPGTGPAATPLTPRPGPYI